MICVVCGTKDASCGSMQHPYCSSCWEKKPNKELYARMLAAHTAPGKVPGYCVSILSIAVCATLTVCALALAPFWWCGTKSWEVINRCAK